MNLTTFLKISTCFLFLSILSSGCIFNSSSKKWPCGFPNRAEHIKYKRDPIQSFNKTNNTYTVTTEFMINTVNDKTFIDEILIWKNQNGIE